jgi:hypothetical protein
MPRIDDYINARKIAAERLAKEPLDKILRRSGFAPADKASLRVPFLNRTYRIQYPEFEFVDETGTGGEIPIQEQILILHYLLASGSRPLSGQWVSYREIPGAAFYYSAFVKRAVDPLKTVFGQNIEGLSASAVKLNGKLIEPGDAGFEFVIFPHVPLQIILYAGDAEFPAEASILFDINIAEILSPEDIAWMAGMVVYRLIFLSKA